MKNLMCLFSMLFVFAMSFTAMAQEAVAPEEGVTVNEAPAPDDQTEAVSDEVAVPEQAVQPIVVEKGAVLVEAPVTVRVNVPDQPAPIVNVNVPRGLAPVVNFTAPPPPVEEKGWCASHPVGCAFLVIGVTGAATAGGFIIADQAGAFDRSNSVNFR